jgi:hypothetical protein
MSKLAILTVSGGLQIGRGMAKSLDEVKNNGGGT